MIDPTEMPFRHRCTFAGFDLTAFDRFVAALPDGETKQQFLADRSRAKAAPTSDKLRIALQVLHFNMHRYPVVKKGQRKGTRAARRPQLAAWLDGQLRRQPELTAKELLRSLPESDAGETLYQTVDGVVEIGKDGQPSAPLTLGGLEGQVTNARKRIAASH